MKNVLVIGGSGFIGSHVVEAMVDFGFKVRVLCRSINSFQVPLPNVDYRLGNFNDTAFLSETLENIDIVFHLVSSTVPATSNRDPVGDVNSNLTSSIRLLQLMQQQSVPEIVFLSSGGTVYGIPSTERIDESHPLKPICSYGVVKVAIENYLYMFQELYGIKSLVLRVSNPYGPRQARVGVQGAISTFVNRTLAKESIQIWGDGTTVRDYVYVKDVASICVKAAESFTSGVFNVGSGIGYSLLDVIDAITAVSGERVTPTFLPARSFDVPSIVLNIDRAKSQFHWEPSTPFHEGISLTWEWFKGHVFVKNLSA